MNETKNQYYTEITAKHNLFDLNLKEVWQYRDLIWLFTKRNFVVKSNKLAILLPENFLYKGIFILIPCLEIRPPDAVDEREIVPVFAAREFAENAETTDARYFGPEELPELAGEKNTAAQIQMCFEAYREENWKTLLD